MHTRAYVHPIHPALVHIQFVHGHMAYRCNGIWTHGVRRNFVVSPRRGPGPATQGVDQRSCHTLIFFLFFLAYICTPRLYKAMYNFVEQFNIPRSGPSFLISLIFRWCNGRRPRNVLRKFETIWTSGSLVIAVCSLKLKTDFSNLQASFGLPLRKCTGKYNFQVSKLYVFSWHGCVVFFGYHESWNLRFRLYIVVSILQHNKVTEFRYQSFLMPASH